MKGLIFFLLGFVLVILEVHAISVASDYLTNDTLEIVEGNSKIYSIRLQNPTEQEIGIKLDYDTAFMKVIDYKEVYNLPPKTGGYKILFNVTASKKPGLFTVGYTVSEVEPGGGGGLPIRLKINRNFKLRVIEDPNKSHFNYSSLAFVAILLIIAFFLFRKKRGTKKKKNRKVNK